MDSRFERELYDLTKMALENSSIPEYEKMRTLAYLDCLRRKTAVTIVPIEMSSDLASELCREASIRNETPTEHIINILEARND